MNNKYKTYDNYMKIEMLQTAEWNITNGQLILLMQLSKEIKENESRIDPISESNKYSSIFLKQLLFFEQNNNSAIEGSQTQFDELFEDEIINDNDTWETKNLINTAMEILEDIKNDVFSLNIDTIINIHKKLYSNKEHKTAFDNEVYIKSKRPGYILKAGDPANWIGRKTDDRERDFREALLIPVIPEDKYDALENLINETRDKIENTTLSILEISRFHVIFEGIHPFADGNGRLGRLLMMILFQITGITSNTILPFSEYIYNNKKEYIENLNSAQVTGNYNAWNFYFINVIIEAKKIHTKIINKMVRIYNQYYPLIKKGNEGIVFNKFLRHIKLNREKTIQRLINEGMSQATAYRAFNAVVKTIGATEENGYYVFEDIWGVYKNNT